MAAATCCCCWFADVARAAPSPLDICITMAETAISDLQIPSEVVMLERKIWTVNREHRWKMSLSQLLQLRDKKTRIPDPAGGPKNRKAFAKVIMKFVKRATENLKIDSCGRELNDVLTPTNLGYQSLVAEKHSDLDYIIGLADLSIKWLAEQITLIQ